MAKAKTKNPSTKCQVCNHADCGVINLALAQGAAVPLIAARFKGLSTFSLYRHFHNHISAPVLDRLRVRALAGIVGKNISLAELTSAENQSILSQVVVLKASLMGAIQAAERANAGTLMSSLVGRLTDLLALETRILGMVQTGSQTTVHNYIASDNFIQVRAALIAALRPFPDAARAVSRALLQIESPKDIVDVESTQIADATVVPALEIGTSEADSLPLASATDAEVPPQNLSSAREVSTPPVIRLEQAVDGATVARLER